MSEPITIPEIPAGYCWLVRWDEKDAQFFVHIYKSTWISKDYFHNVEGHWAESYKASAKTFGAAMHGAIAEYQRAKEITNDNQTTPTSN